LLTVPDDLFEAIQQHDAERVGFLLSAGADPNALSVGSPRWHPLEAAIEEVYHDGPPDVMLEIIRRLVQHGADVNAWDDEHRLTPLLAAVYWGNRAAARLLLEAGAHPNVVNRDRESPLSLAVEQDDPETVALLLRHGARDIDRVGGVSGMTPLAMAASNLSLPILKLLLDAGADPEQQDTDNSVARNYLPPREQSDPEAWDTALEMLSFRDD
jgi:uncharacterized protein